MKIRAADAPDDLQSSTNVNALMRDHQALSWHNRPTVPSYPFWNGRGKDMNSLRTPRRVIRGAWRALAVFAALAALVTSASTASAAEVAGGQNLVADPSFEQFGPADQFGHVFAKWGGWKYEGECEFRVGRVAHGGKTSCLLFGGSQPKIRISQTFPKLPAGRYQITAWIRGLDIGTGVWNQTTEFMFNDKYMNLKKNGTFGWTPLRYVADVPGGKDGLGPSFGLMASGYFWIDDVVMQKVGTDVPLTPEPELGKEERPIEPPGALSAVLAAGSIRCPECGYKSMPEWKTCYACGTALGAAKQGPTGPPTRLLTSFEDRSPMEGVKVVAQHATDGAKAGRIDKGYAVWDGLQDWSGYDYLLVDLFVDAAKPLELYVELQDQATRDYWTRVNYNTLAPPGKSTLVLPLEQLYVGEKSRPGRRVMLNAIKRFVLAAGDNPPGPLFVDNIRLQRDTQTPTMLFDGLWAFDLGPSQSPLMPGFTRIDPATRYSAGRGYGLKDAVIWRAFDALQPDPLYQDFLCIERGGLAVDVPNGRYHVMVNIDSPSGFWGEYQVYNRRAVLAEGKPVVDEKMDLDRFKKQYFRFWDVEDRAADNTFDKYQRRYFQEKHFDVEVRDGQLNVDFQGDNWGCCVSAVVVFPVEKAAEGKRFLDFVTERRRFFFDNYFHRVLHKPTGDPVAPTAEDTQRGYVTFARDYMKDVYDNDTPLASEVGQPVRGFGFADEMEPLTLAVYPLADLGRVTVRATDLTGPATIPASCIRAGWVSNRISRVSADGAVYTIEPRLVMPGATADVPKGLTRRFWLTIRPPKDAAPGVYRGQLRIEPEHGRASSVPIEYRVCKGMLDAADIPVGPWGHEIRLPWLESDPATARWNETLARRSMEKIREYGFTTFTGLPLVFYRGFKNGKPELDFTAGDRQMQLARQCGFSMPVVSYVGMPGLDLYHRDEAAMRAAGFTDYSKFVKAVFSAIQTHANQAGWLPVYWNLGDEPLGDDLRRAAENAEAYHAAFGQGPPWFTAATSFTGDKADDPHFRFARALTAPNLNLHDEASVRALQKLGAGWGFYNGGNRWTYGTYMYKAAKQFDMKFRLSWHWNVVAGDPYYALDCREDDYAWCNSSPEGELIPSVHFERDMREGLDDYRYLLTLARLADARNDAQAKDLIRKRLDSFKLGQREHDELLPADDWSKFRWQAVKEIERLR